MKERYFPQGVATDGAFCNRENERSLLKASIAVNEHIVLVAPRRLGKTSLISQVLKEITCSSVNIDFFFVLTQSEVQKQIEEGVSKIVSELLPKAKSASQKIISAIANTNPKLSLNLLGQKLEISTKQTTEQSISELLLALDQVAVNTKKSCVIVFDEFQQIGELKDNHAIEAAIRHAVERSKSVSYIFCGSKRHLLNEMFSDKTRPLYHLCDLMTIDRIKKPSYQKFLKKKSKQMWGKELDSDIIDEIIHLTEAHPYYVNALCRRLWRETKLPAMGLVRRSWRDYVNLQGPWIINDISKLTLNRRKIMTALAIQPTSEPQSQAFSTRVGVGPSAIKKSIVYLEDLDQIYRNKIGEYRIFDPAVAFFIRENK